MAWYAALCTGLAVSLIECWECGGAVSTQADRCPHCGAPPPSETETEILETVRTALANDLNKMAPERRVELTRFDGHFPVFGRRSPHASETPFTVPG